MTGGTLLRLGSRSSPLARVQVEWVAARLQVCSALVWIASTGDADRQTALPAFGGTGVFTIELHRALKDDRIDAAVHSLKDLPAGEEDGISLCCVPAREDPHDVLVARDGLTLATLPEGAKIGTGSPRRAAQLLRRRPDLRMESLRGNVDTRLARVREGRIDATVLAAAGLTRLGREDVVSEVLDYDVCLPAAGQGALGITVRAGDAASEALLAGLRDVDAAATTSAERACLHALGAGCHAPVGAHAVLREGRVRLQARVLACDGREEVAGEAEGTLAEAAQVGRDLASRLLADGAGPLVAGPP